MKRWLIVLMIAALLAGTVCLSQAEDASVEEIEETVESEPEPEPEPAMLAEPQPEPEPEQEPVPEPEPEAVSETEDEGEPEDESDPEQEETPDEVQDSESVPSIQPVDVGEETTPVEPDPGENPGDDVTPTPEITPTPSLSPEAPTEEPEEEEASKQVVRIQVWLYLLEYLPEEYITGIYDEATILAVAAFQEDYELPVTGICDDVTYALLKTLAKVLEPTATPTPTISPSTSPSRSPSASPSVSPSASAKASTKSSGSSSGSSAAENVSEETKEWLNGVTPGEALTSSHVSGNKNTTAYGSVDLDGNTMLPGFAIENGTYVHSVDGAVLQLTGTGSAPVWHFDGEALHALSRSGVQWVTLNAGNGIVTLNTANSFTGVVYDMLRTAGYTDNTFTYTVSGGEITVIINGQRYRAASNGFGRLVLSAE